MTEREAIAYIEDYTWSTSRLGLERTRELLKKLGDPQKKAPFCPCCGQQRQGKHLRHAGFDPAPVRVSNRPVHVAVYPGLL